MTFGINPKDIDQLSLYEISIYARLIPLYQEYQQEQMVSSIQKAISELL